MAERRMFAKTVIDSDTFIDMPQSSQLLYFHLAIHADDDGFINNPKSIMRTTGCKDDDLRLLIAKQYIIPFNSGVVVIRHWRVHNTIQKDRYSETKCMEEKALLEVGGNKEYRLSSTPTETDCIQPVSRMDTECIQSVSTLDTQVRLGKDSIGKVRLDKVNKEQERCDFSRKTDRQNDFDVFWAAYPKKVGKIAAQKAFAKVGADIKTILDAIETQKQSVQWRKDGGQYIPNPATWLNQGRWEDEPAIETDHGRDGLLECPSFASESTTPNEPMF